MSLAVAYGRATVKQLYVCTQACIFYVPAKTKLAQHTVPKRKANLKVVRNLHMLY